MEAFVQAANRRGSTRNSSFATAGAAENLALIADGKLELGHSTSVDWMVAASGRTPYRTPIVCQQMFAYATWHMPPVVREDSGIGELEDLRGRRYAPSTPGSAAALMHHTLMRAAGLHDEIRWTYGSWNQIYDAFKSKRVDVVPGVITNDAVSARLMEAQAVVDVVPLVVPPPVMKRAQEINPGIFAEPKTRDTWSALASPTVLPYSVGILAAAADTSAETGYEITKAIFDDAERIRDLGLALRYVNPSFALRALIPAFPVNRGALEYFRENGVRNDELSIIADP
jgi:TRAP transporter TAXI family solute receptor